MARAASIGKMVIPSNFKSFIGNARVVEILFRAVERNRLPHALIFAGPPGVGKCTLAILLAQYLNCYSATPEGGCGTCASCRRILAVLESRYISCLSLKGQAACGSCPNCRTLSSRHPDVRLVQPEKTTIRIEQIRELISEIAFQPFEAKYRVVILDPAEQMRLEAHNSMLKTLEEPPSSTFIILVTSNPYMLLPTIRSRARLLHFGGIPQRRIQEYLMKEGRPREEAELAALFSQGSLGAALTFDSTQYREARTWALQFVFLLLKRGRFAELSALAAALTKDKDLFLIWLDATAAILRDIYYAQVFPSRAGQPDLSEQLAGLARSTPRAEVVSAISAVKSLRSALQNNVNRQIALESLFLRQTGVTEGTAGHPY